MEDKNLKKLVADAFLDIAKGVESGSFGKRIKVGLTTLGSEHGAANLIAGAELAVRQNDGLEVVLIGEQAETELPIVETDCEADAHRIMEEMLGKGKIDACVTMHYNFEIGISTVGRVLTPGRGKEMYLATTTGTSAAQRSVGMVKNALYGIIAAKAMGVSQPTVGILNLDGARQVQRALYELKDNGYPIEFAESLRADGGSIMRGNDLLAAASDVMVMDTLTGNIMMKVFSSYTTGGSYEASGFGYGPGVGFNMDKIVLILSRASGVPVVANAIAYAAKLAKNNLITIAKDEYAKAKKAGLDDILAALTESAAKPQAAKKAVAMPDKEVVTAQISGIDIMDLEDAVNCLLENGIYAESGMGCTGPIALVSEANQDKATALLRNEKFIL
ncbi:MAG: glycine reductase [Clostridiales bacterium]|nr:MAG: glycine reductase [Clostridiales bacterium]